MSSKIVQVSVVVEKQSDAVDFYTKKVGFKKKIDFPTPAGNRWIVVGPEDGEVGLALLEAGWRDDSGLGRVWKAGQGAPIVIQVEDCKKAYNEMKGRGVAFKKVWGEELKTVPYGTVAFFADPDGNLFEVLEPSQALTHASPARREHVLSGGPESLVGR